MINHHIPSSQRATILSVDSLFSELGSGVGQSGWGYLARRQGIGHAWVAAGAFLRARHPAARARAPRGSRERSLRRAGAGAGGGGLVSPERPPLPAGTLTFLFTDIEGSTRLVQALGEARFNAVLEDHGRLVAGAFDAEGGHRVRMEGDSFFVVFAARRPRPSRRPRRRSARCAGARVRRRRRHPRADGAAHRRGRLGSAATGADYVGYDVHRAARIASAGHGGQVLLSRAGAASWCATRCRPASALRDLGEHRLKDLAAPSGSSSS